MRRPNALAAFFRGFHFFRALIVLSRHAVYDILGGSYPSQLPIVHA